MSANEALPPWFLSDDPRAVLAAAAALEGLGSGRVQRPETINRRTGKPERSGLHCAKIFGPVADYQCLCCKYSSREFAGTTCEKCGVLCGERRLRDERWAHVESPVPLLHPRLAPRAAATLGCSVKGLLAVIHGEAHLRDDGAVVSLREQDADYPRGLNCVVERLGERVAELMLTRIPVTPPGWRSTRSDPQDAAYMRFLNRCNRLQRLIELDAPRIILDNEATLTQLALEKLYEVVGAELRVRGPVVRAPVTPRAEELLRAVFDAPDDDDARRAYAEFLRSHGDPRGAFILRQLASASCSRMPRSERDQLRRNFDEWLAPLVDAVAPYVTFRRGFLAGCKTTPRARERLGEPAWSTVEHLDTDLAELVADPVMRSLRSLVVPYRTLLAVCEGPAVLHRVRALQVRLSRSPPPHAEVVTRAEALPAVRELTLIHGGKRGGLDLTWLDGTPLVSRLERLTVVTASDALGALELRWWLSLLARHPALGRVDLSLGKLLDFELRREDGEPALRVVMSRLAIEWMMLSESSEIPTLLGQALTAVEPYELPLVRVDSPASWFGDELAALAQRLRAHFGPSIRLPRL